MSDNPAYRYPVSVKGVIVNSGRIVLVRNERQEWELPGGKLDLGETPAQCLEREIREELGVSVTVDQLIDVWVYEISTNVRVLIVTFGVKPLKGATFTLSEEHNELAEFPPEEIAALNMPSGYRASIASWLGRLPSAAT
jgi:mutator protein MutT